MLELLGVAETMLSTSQRRLEVISGNISNTETSGFKRTQSFDAVLTAASDGVRSETGISTYLDLTSGALSATGSPLDIAISSGGFFQLSDGEQALYSRAGRFSIAADGRVVNGAGLALQAVSGGDVILPHDQVEILEDGTVLDAGLPVARIALFVPESVEQMQALGGSMFAADDAAMQLEADPVMHQGMLEGANVELASEMTAMMMALRQAEMGSRLVQTYDQLIGQAITTFGRSR